MDEQAGGRVFEERGFRAVVPNITPDPETGIGRWTEAEVATAIREGRRATVNFGATGSTTYTIELQGRAAVGRELLEVAGGEAR